MPFTREYDSDQNSAPAVAACIHLRSKAMYVIGERGADQPDEFGVSGCWCNMTQHVFGPDNQGVGRQECVSGRECFQETY
jgi:hypothetical protein